MCRVKMYKKCSLNIGSLNIQGLNEKLDDNMFVNMLNNYDIFFFQETWLDSSQASQQLNIENFISVNKCRSKKLNARRGSGGISILYKKKLSKFISMVKSESDFIVWLKVDKRCTHYHSDLFIGAVYVPPNGSAYSIQPFEIIQEELSKFSKKGNIILMGDFNSRTGNLNDFDDNFIPVDDSINSMLFDNCNLQIPEKNNRDVKINKYGKQLINMCIDNDLKICNGRLSGDLLGQCTYYSKKGNSCIDYALIQTELLNVIRNFQVCPPSYLSDHCVISLNLEIKNKTHSINYEMLELMPDGFKWQPESKFIFEKYIHSSEFITKINNFNEKEETDSNVNGLCTELTDLILEAGKKSLKTKCTSKCTYGNKKKARFDPSIDNLKCEIKSLGRACHIQPFNTMLVQSLIAKRKIYRRLVKKHNVKCKTEMLNKIGDLQEKHPKQFWNLINSLKDNAKQGSHSVNSEVFYQFFKNLNDVKNTDSNDKFEKFLDQKINKMVQQNKNVDILDNEITLDETCKTLTNLKNGKSAGLDSIVNEMLKYGKNVFSKPLTKLFNVIMSTNCYPKSWTEGLIVPILKSGNLTDPNNYRGITLSSSVGKIFTKILSDRLMKFVTENEILHNAQIGFMPKKQTSDHIFVLKSIIDLYKTKRKHVFACFVDLKKAFDTVWRKGLLFKILCYGISPKFCKILQSMYSQLTACVKLGNKKTKSFVSTIGTRQGCPLSPMLFNLFLNDIPRLLSADKLCKPIVLGDQKINLLMYADDIVILSHTQKGLQHSLDNLYSYCRRWNLNVNIQKTKIMIFNCIKTGKYEFTFGNNQVEICTSYSYLGITFTSNGKFKKCIEVLENKASRALFKLMNNIKPCYNVNVKTFCKLFDSLIEPILLYGSEVWSMFNISKPLLLNSKNIDDFLYNLLFKYSRFNRIHIRFCKQVLQLSRYSIHACSLFELGRIPLILRQMMRATKYFIRITKVRSDKLLNAAIQAHRENDFIYMQSIEKLLNWSHLNIDVCKNNSQQLNDVSVKYKYFLRKSYDSCVLKYLSVQDGKLLQYKNFKKSNLMEKYLTVHNFEHRKAVTKLRVSDHHLPIEIGRKQNIERKNRTCTKCTENIIGDELHVLFECHHPELTKLRFQFLTKIYSIVPQLINFNNKNKLEYILGMFDETINNITAKYCYRILKMY